MAREHSKAGRKGSLWGWCGVHAVRGIKGDDSEARVVLFFGRTVDVIDTATLQNVKRLDRIGRDADVLSRQFVLSDSHGKPWPRSAARERGRHARIPLPCGTRSTPPSAAFRPQSTRRSGRHSSPSGF